MQGKYKEGYYFLTDKLEEVDWAHGKCAPKVKIPVGWRKK